MANFIVFVVLGMVLKSSQAGISYQSVSFVHGPSKTRSVRPFHPIPPPHNHRPRVLSVPPHPRPQYPISPTKFFENQLQHSFGDEVWPASIFDDPVEFLDVTLDHSSPPVIHSLAHPHEHEHDFINKLELPPDPYLLTGYQAKQVAKYLYSHELFFNDIPHAKALLKLQEKRLANGLRPNRLGSLNVRSPFDREQHKHYPF